MTLLVGQLIILTTALLGLTTGILAYLNGRKTKSKIDEIKIEVDGHLSEVLTRVTQLTQTLDENDILVPRDPAVDSTRHEEANARTMVLRADKRIAQEKLPDDPPPGIIGSEERS